MKNFCVTQMRREYRAVLRTIKAAAIILTLFFILYDLILIANHRETDRLLILIGMELVIILPFFGAYLIFSDEKWLLKKTPFGQELLFLGDPAEVMADIDRAAEAFYEHHGSFILLRGWMILLLPDGWNWEPYRCTGCPIQRSEIQSLRLLPDVDPEDPEERHIQITWFEGEEDFYTYERQDLDALRNWMLEGGLTVDE